MNSEGGFIASNLRAEFPVRHGLYPIREPLLESDYPTGHMPACAVILILSPYQQRTVGRVLYQKIDVHYRREATHKEKQLFAQVELGIDSDSSKREYEIRNDLRIVLSHHDPLIWQVAKYPTRDLRVEIRSHPMERV